MLEFAEAGRREDPCIVQSGMRKVHPWTSRQTKLAERTIAREQFCVRLLFGLIEEGGSEERENSRLFEYKPAQCQCLNLLGSAFGQAVDATRLHYMQGSLCYKDTLSCRAPNS